MVGDSVTTTNLSSNLTSNPTEPHTVTALITGQGVKHLVDVTISTSRGPSTLEATYNHPFWVDNRSNWVEAQDLTSGEQLHTAGGARTAVVAIHRYDAVAKVYNLTVAEAHTYYVVAGSTPVLVHNSSGCTDIALGLQKVGDNGSAIDEFGFDIGAVPYKQWPGNKPWYDQLKAYMSDGKTKIHMNLDGIPDPIAYAQSGKDVDPATDWEGYTSWEMYLISSTPGAWDRVTFYRDGKVCPNPFGG